MTSDLGWDNVTSIPISGWILSRMLIVVALMSRFLNGENLAFSEALMFSGIGSLWAVGYSRWTAKCNLVDWLAVTKGKNYLSEFKVHLMTSTRKTETLYHLATGQGFNVTDAKGESISESRRSDHAEDLFTLPEIQWQKHAHEPWSLCLLSMKFAKKVDLVGVDENFPSCFCDFCSIIDWSDSTINEP